jgi:hypothetical protein
MVTFLFVFVFIVARAQTDQPWQPCIGLATSQCQGFDFSSFTASDWTAVGTGAWERTPEGTLKVVAPVGTATGAACARTGGSALLRPSATALPGLRSARVRVRLLGTGAAGFVFRHVDGNQYGTLQVFNDVSCGGISGIVGGVARHEGNTFVKQPWIGSADFSIAPNTWYTFSLDLINTMVRWKLQSDQFTEGNVNAFFSDPIWGFLADKVNATGGGGFGFWCSPGATCEFDNAVLFDTAVRAKLTGHLACHYCNFTWPVPSADWCRCCQYSCGGVGESTRDACRANGFCTTANRCQNTADDEKGFPVTFCTPHSITASDKPVVESTAISAAQTLPPTTTTTAAATSAPASDVAALSRHVAVALVYLVSML